jgi:hypothetical protein
MDGSKRSGYKEIWMRCVLRRSGILECIFSLYIYIYVCVCVEGVITTSFNSKEIHSVMNVTKLF